MIDGPRWAGWGVSRAPGRERGAIALFLPLAIALTVAVSIVTLFLACVAVPLVGGGAIAAIRRRRARRLVRALEAGEDEVAVGVRIETHPRRIVLGHDEGLLCHETGWLIFRGDRTEWSVRVRDVAPDPESAAFRFPAPDGSMRRAVLDPLSEEAALFRTLRDWWAAEGPAEPSVYPPSVLSPDRCRWWLGDGWGVLAVLIPAFAGLAVLEDVFGAIGVLVGGVVIAGGITVRNRRRAVLDGVGAWPVVGNGEPISPGADPLPMPIPEKDR